FPELRGVRRPVSKDFPRDLALRALQMLVDKTLQGRDILLSFKARRSDQLWVVAVEELALKIQNVRHAAGHSRAKVFARRSENHHGAVGHVFAAMIPRTLDNSCPAGIPNTEALPATPIGEERTAGGSVHHGVAKNNAIVR